jgi:hypothetical protein
MRKILIILIGLSLILPLSALAVKASTCDEYCNSLKTANPKEPPDNQVCICNPLKAEEFEVIADNIINFLFKIAIVLAPLMMVIGAVLFVTSGGNLSQITRAKNIILWTAVGFLILLLAKGIMALIESILGIG